ncbi:MAG TPA: (5-formylfuran-3-yl)methyl phosphate synthase [Candidatus Lokiarchaeia archaeon]|nr:(5-formylfuran-3-yl)methyl phosphate synthase [Candidatus Lokiarchaeia archaeon]
MKLLVSPKNVDEANEAIKGDCDIVDCKNPEEGSLGANFPWVIQEMKAAISSSQKFGIQLSATIGDMPYLPGTASLAAAGLATMGVDYIKVGVHGPKTKDQARKLLENIVRATKDVDDKIFVVAAAYADYKRIKTSIPPLDLVDVAAEAGCNVVMVDTAIKDAKGLMDFMDHDEISRFCSKGEQAGLLVALAGRLKMQDIPFLKTTGASIIGVRSMVCQGFDRLNGAIDASLVKQVKELLAVE